MMATGHHVDPYLPRAWPGQDTFRGRLLHSHSYKDHRGFEDQRVVVVGVGNSGADIASELSRIAEQVYLVTRRGTWVVNRIFTGGAPVDMTNNRFVHFLKRNVPDRLANWYFESLLQNRFDHAKYSLKPAHRVLNAHLTINDDLPNRIAAGTIIVKPNIERFQENGLVFEDGTTANSVDAVILCTGYSFRFPLVETGRLIPVRDNRCRLYKFMYPANLAPENTLCILGLTQPLGSIVPISEMQTRLFCEALSANISLPTERDMNEDIDLTMAKMARTFVASRRHTIQVDYISYMDELAEILGVSPQIKSLLFKDFELAKRLIFGPTTAYQYRLFGPHVWPGARRAIMETEARIDAPLCTRKVPQDTNEQKHKKFKFLLVLCIFVAFALRVYFWF